MHHIKKSVVIVGSGGAGLRCALELREQGMQDILIVGDRKFTDAHTTRARGGINAALGTMDPEDNTLTHAVDTYREAVEVGNPNLIEMLANEAPQAIADLVGWGANFHREDDGSLTQRFFGAHSYRRTCFSGDETGLEMIKTLTRRSYELEIPYLEFLYVYDLIVSDGKVQGIRGIKNDEEYCIEAPVVVFATGGYPNVYRRSSSRNKENFGEGVWMALQAGAKIGDLELIQFHPTGLLYPESHSGELVTEAVRGEGGILRNSEGERFMKMYDPLKLELSTRDVVARANFREIIEGRGTPNGGVRLDISQRDAAYIKERLPKMYSMIKEFNNVDITKEAVEVAPTTHYTMGGIYFDADTMQTDIEGFFVAGECTMGVHGANRLGGNSLMETMVFGKKVAEAILSLNITHLPIAIDDVSDDCLGCLHIDDTGIAAEDLLEEVRRHVWRLAGILRTQEELQELLTYLQTTRERLHQHGIAVQGSKQEQVVTARRVAVVIDLAVLITQGALERKESRGAHFRVDYPESDPTYRKNYMHQKRGSEICSFWVDVIEPSARLQEGMETIQRTENYGHSE